MSFKSLFYFVVVVTKWVSVFINLKKFEILFTDGNEMRFFFIFPERISANEKGTNVIVALVCVCVCVCAVPPFLSAKLKVNQPNHEAKFLQPKWNYIIFHINGRKKYAEQNDWVRNLLLLAKYLWNEWKTNLQRSIFLGWTQVIRRLYINSNTRFASSLLFFIHWLQLYCEPVGWFYFFTFPNILCIKVRESIDFALSKRHFSEIV